MTAEAEQCSPTYTTPSYNYQLSTSCHTKPDGIDEDGNEATPDEHNVVVEGVASVVKSTGCLWQRNSLVQKRVDPRDICWS